MRQAKTNKSSKPTSAIRAAMKPPNRLEKALTGIAGLDEITFGGLPRGRATLICGSPGCGKTLLGVEFLVNGARTYSEPGVFIALRRIRERYMPGRCTIEVIDLMRNPELAKADQIIAIPTLVRKLPPSVRRIIGDLSATEKIVLSFELDPG